MTFAVGAGRFSTLVGPINELLARGNCPRRIYECESGGDWYAFLATTPDEIERLVAAGLLKLVPS